MSEPGIWEKREGRRMAGKEFPGWGWAEEPVIRAIRSNIIIFFWAFKMEVVIDREMCITETWWVSPAEYSHTVRAQVKHLRTPLTFPSNHDSAHRRSPSWLWTSGTRFACFCTFYKWAVPFRIQHLSSGGGLVRFIGPYTFHSHGWRPFQRMVATAGSEVVSTLEPLQWSCCKHIWAHLVFPLIPQQLILKIFKHKKLK